MSKLVLFFVIAGCSIAFAVWEALRLPKHYILRAKSENIKVLQVVEELNASKYEPGSTTAAPAQFEVATVYNKEEDFTYLHYTSGSELAPLLVLPPMFLASPKCIERLVDAVHRDVYVLLQHGMLEEPRTALRNEYLSTDDIEALIDVIHRPLYLVGYSAGAMRCCNYVCSTHNGFILKVFALFTPFDPLQPVFMGKKAEREIGSSIRQFVIKNRTELVAQGFATPRELADLCAECTMSKFDELWARKLDITLEEYYNRIQPRFRLASAESEIFFFSSVKDEITGRLVPSREELGSCSLIKTNAGQHLGCPIPGGDLSALFVARMIENI